MTKQVSFRQLFDKALQDHVIQMTTPLEMAKPMMYALNTGGKRLRPLLLLTVLSILKDEALAKGLQTAIALEFIHTYSLIHDDLPAMDNDDLRRGQPTAHIQFDEATAILAGDGLQTDAFAIISQDRHLSDQQKVKLVTELSLAAGSAGMVAGQLYDMRAQEQATSLSHLQQIHEMKTGRLFVFAVRAAGIIAQVEEGLLAGLTEWGQHFGVAYQIHNDLKDVVEMGDHTDSLIFSDLANKKTTYPSLLGISRAKNQLAHELDQARAVMKCLSQENNCSFEALESFLEPLGRCL